MCTTHAERKRVIDTTDDAYLVTLPTTPSCSWILDSGASRHMSGFIDDFSTMAPHRGTITIAGGHKIPIEGTGTVILLARLPDGATRRTELTNVLYSRELQSTRLFSWPYVRAKGFTLTGKGITCTYMMTPPVFYGLDAPTMSCKYKQKSMKYRRPLFPTRNSMTR